MTVELSVVIPIRNESPNIDVLYVEMTEALERLGRPYEVLAIDDGSTDDSFDRLVRCQQRDPRWRIIRFRRNFGQTAAFSAVFNRPDGAILAVGKVRDEPMVKDGQVKPGKKLSMTLSCDHRVIDGAVGAAFLAELRDLLERPMRILTG